MHYFAYRNDELYCEDVPLARIAAEVGTPAYVYSRRTLVHHARVFRQAFPEALICFAVKANSNISILHTLAQEGIGADIVSGGELFRARRAGVEPENIVFAGVGKREDEIAAALKQDIFMFNVESIEELNLIQRVAQELNTTARIALRVNPDVDAKTHPYISTGLRENKFGISMDSALMDYHYAHRLSHIQVQGIHCHIGSQLTTIEPFIDAFKIIRALALELIASGIDIRYLDMGGGLGITYEREKPPLPMELAHAMAPLMEDLPCTLILEPGRAIAGNTGVFLTQVLYTKQTEEKRFIVVDGAMNDLARPSLYGSFHDIRPVQLNTSGEEPVKVDIVGPICESSDFFARERLMPACHHGDILAIMSAGAYGFTMSSNYNSRPRAVEVLVDDDQYRIIRRRETLEDLIQHEELPQ
ncbi:diaminopimelate decarboxylase [Desulfurispira natronophila]|uniref:Diaminopimelate decarboxylase n=1 Tax=Desulfurispira natronophila TaxID=682562 RepID=A0A7W8DGL6_9BACT|nr:diaminopimelate decarboxylase [Desulfurispira natronophila]MBB5021509.1 diaminopimelate decarboxylase [Desulfurispira natronophila]